MTRVFLTIALGAAAIASSAVAQMPKGGAGVQADVTRAQVQQQAMTMFVRLDLNHDGTLTRAEAEKVVAQIGAQRGANGGQGGNRVERMIMQTLGGAPSITRAQFIAQALARFDAIDLNHDGVLSAAERQQARAARSAQSKPTT